MARILIVEDEVDTAKVLEKRISDSGHETSVVYDAYNATAFLHKEKFDLVLLDLMLPAGGGVSVLKNLRQTVHTGHTAVIILTAIWNDDYKKMVENMGVDAFLTKPYDPDVLLNTIKKVLDGHEG